MQDLPEGLVDILSVSQLDSAILWWRTLSLGSKMEFVRMWDARAENCAYYGYVEGERLVWQELPIELRGRFVDEEALVEHDEYKRQLLEYVNNHEEVQFFLTERSFHICRSHKKARDCIANGLIPASFVCPLSSKECPLLHVLAQRPGKSVAIDVHLHKTQ